MGGDRGRCVLLWEVIVGGVGCCGRWSWEAWTVVGGDRGMFGLLWEVIV